MEANLCEQLFSAAEGGSAQMSNLGKHGLPESICAFAFTGVSEDLKTGYLYQIDHKHLPPKSPNQLKAIRVVMLAEKNEMNVSVRFPSSYALRSYFTLPKKVNTVQPTRKYPDLDEQFVMGLKLAKVVLIRQIFPPELQQQGRLQSFWLVPQNVTEVSTSTVDDNSNDGLCGSTLNPGSFPTWGVRRRITFVKKRMEENTTTQRVSSFSSLVKEEDGAADLDVDSADDETTIVTRKRKRRSCRNKKKTPSKAFTYEKKKPGNRIAKRPKLSYGRWSRERYKNAEVKMLEIMKEKGAVYGKPMLRPVLRSEARQHIGDTGLLDHLLKHMSGKVAPNGIDRFRRRHNSDGHMEYWLESADLIEIRKEAGVSDPYWTPPQGWKPGDSLSQDPNTAREITQLKEEIASMRRDMQEVITWKKSSEENGDKAIIPYTKSSSAISILESNDKAISHPMEDYDKMMKRKLELEEEMAQLSGALKLLEEEKKKAEEIVEEGGASDCVILEVIAENDKKDADMEEASETKAARRERLRSGFRICKPQGTFLWPDMGSAGCSAGNNSGTTSADTGNIWSPHQVLVQQVDSSNIVPIVPTPPSVSSATTSPPSFLLPSPPIAEKLPFATVTNITHSSSTITTSTCEQGDNLNILQGYCGTPTSCFPISRPFLLPATNVASVGAKRPHLSTPRTYQRKHYQHQQQQTQNQQDAAYYRRNWLALATPTTSIAQ